MKEVVKYLPVSSSATTHPQRPAMHQGPLASLLNTVLPLRLLLPGTQRGVPGAVASAVENDPTFAHVLEIDQAWDCCVHY